MCENFITYEVLHQGRWDLLGYWLLSLCYTVNISFGGFLSGVLFPVKGADPVVLGELTL